MLIYLKFLKVALFFVNFSFVSDTLLLARDCVSAIKQFSENEINKCVNRIGRCKNISLKQSSEMLFHNNFYSLNINYCLESTEIYSCR